VKTRRGIRHRRCWSKTVFQWYSKDLTNKALEGFGDLKIGGQVILNVKYANDFVLMAKEETVMVCTTDTMNEIGRCYGREKDVKKTKVMGILRQPSQVSVITDQKQLKNVGYFNYLGSIITNNARYTCEITSRIVTAKAKFNKNTLFHQQTGLKFKEQNRRKLALKHGFLWC
jgi:hypothetical protein